MDTPLAKYRCPACERPVLNRRVGHCLHCGASLPVEFHLPDERSRQLDEEAARQAQRRQDAAPAKPPATDHPVQTLVDGIDVIRAIKDLFD